MPLNSLIEIVISKELIKARIRKPNPVEGLFISYHLPTLKRKIPGPLAKIEDSRTTTYFQPPEKVVTKIRTNDSRSTDPSKIIKEVS